MMMMMNDDLNKNTGIVAYGFFKAFLNEQKENLEKFLIKFQVGFIPQGIDFSVYQKLKKKMVYKQLKFLIGKHVSLPIVLIGLWLNSLPEEEQVQQAKDKRDEVYGQYKEKGVNILNMAVTGFIESFVKFLSNYNLKESPTKEELVDIYEKNLEEWSRITVFVKETHSVAIILEKCKTKFAYDYPFVYVFASYSAIPIAEKVIQACKENELFKESNYEIYAENLTPKGTRKVWIFEKQ